MPTTAHSHPAVPTAPAPPDALAAALQQLLAPLARLALAQGVTHATLDALMKQALVDAADQAHAALPPHRRVSRITTATGIHRREVTRLVAALRDGAGQQPPPARSHASELFAHWRSQPAYLGADGGPASLPRTGAAPSFESLAQAITRDVHPRSLLDELLRLGLAVLDSDSDSVRLVRDGFVPQGDRARMLQVLGRNVGAHLEGAVDNVLHDAAAAADRGPAPGHASGPEGAHGAGPAAASPPAAARHFEQAIFASGLSQASVDEFRQRVAAHWQTTLKTLVPVLEALVARDAAQADSAGPAQAAAQQLRLGMYSHTRTAPHTPARPQAMPPLVAPTENPDDTDAAP